MAEPTLCVVDDDSAVRNSVSELLAGSGFRIKTFGSTQEFLNQFDPNQPGCLLIDIQVPGIEGLDLKKRLEDQKTRFSTIVITAFAQVSLQAAVMKAGATDLIEKPFQKEDLLPRVQAAMELDAETRRDQIRQIEFSNLLHSLTNREREVFEGVVQ
jgi:FixJ family two-component response regulator